MYFIIVYQYNALKPMPKADIFIDEKRISVVGGDGSAVKDGTERGDLEVVSSDGDEPGVSLDAERANIVLGGGRSGATGIRLDGSSVDRDADEYDPAGSQIGVYSDFEAGAPDLVSIAAGSFTYMDMDSRAGIHIGNTSLEGGETNGILVLSEDGAPGAVLGGGELRLGYLTPLNDDDYDGQLPGRISLWGDNATFEMGGPVGTTIDVQSGQANITAGGGGEPGSVTIRDGDANVAGFIEAKPKGLVLSDGEKNEAVVIEQGGKVTFPDTPGLP